jgi:hypothetical protein
MASYALMPIYSGFSFDMTKKHIGFAPVNNEGKYLFSVCNSWGSVDISDGACLISILGEPLTLRSISLPDCKKITRVTVDGTDVKFELINNMLVFGDTVINKEFILS